MKIISWLRRSCLEISRERALVELFTDLEEWVMVKIRGAMSKLHGKVKVLG